MQVQLQLEVCDLDYCDFLECDIRIYNGMRDFLDDSPKGTTSYNFTRSGKRKGVIYEYTEKNTPSNSGNKYKYCSLNLTDEEVSQWISDVKNEIIKDSNLVPIGCKYWWIEEYNVTLLKRDPEYFEEMVHKLDTFWKEVLYYRKNGVEELEIKLGLKPKPTNKLPLFLNTYNDNNPNGDLTGNDTMYYHQVPDSDSIEQKELTLLSFINIDDNMDDISDAVVKDLPENVEEEVQVFLEPLTPSLSKSLKKKSTSKSKVVVE